MDIRVGHGYDVHRLVKNRSLIIGGEHIPHSLGLDGHSDADVLAHAVCDALLGALALGDIGKHFPDSDSKYKNANSIELLKKCYDMVLAQGYQISNLDATVIAQKPKLAEFIPAIRKNLGNTLSVDISRVSVKATTEEHLGFTGEEKGISAHCVVLLIKN